ncbi:unnamed protein product [Acanthoscelides obtectus]|uniref:Uncharacterized protein n=1 Tax=Acanthoscelides obtectus TaxID=200917 RepID=A0A9P0K6A7_ACAOB|nr:unnamed protein product [Acanthoscelides obtectus]CAK1628761.1 hypothetical protein AOBTE_LOCUS5388 [Acanthoscelides obtectus]
MFCLAVLSLTSASLVPARLDERDAILNSKKRQDVDHVFLRFGRERKY